MSRLFIIQYYICVDQRTCEKCFDDDTRSSGRNKQINRNLMQHGARRYIGVTRSQNDDASCMQWTPINANVIPN
jgi:hypothetical protein